MATNAEEPLAQSGVTMRSDSEQYSSAEDFSNSPPSASPPLVLYQPPTIWGVLRGAAINLILPFINGMMLGFGELFAHEAAFRLGWSGTRAWLLIPWSSVAPTQTGNWLTGRRSSLFRENRHTPSDPGSKQWRGRDGGCNWRISRAWSDSSRPAEAGSGRWAPRLYIQPSIFGGTAGYANKNKILHNQFFWFYFRSP